MCSDLLEYVKNEKLAERPEVEAGSDPIGRSSLETTDDEPPRPAKADREGSRTIEDKMETAAAALKDAIGDN
jgi:hypothetical protein